MRPALASAGKGRKAMRGKTGRAVSTVAALWAALAPQDVRADGCKQGARPPQFQPPSRTVVLQILSIHDDGDIEPDPPFYTNRADFQGKVTINGEAFALAQREDTDNPFWPATPAAQGGGIFTKLITGGVANIRIHMEEADSGATGDNDQVDLNPTGGPEGPDLSFTFDLCSLAVSRFLGQPSQGVITVHGQGDNPATLRFTVGMQDDRPATSDELALTYLDVVQVVNQASAFAGGKPAQVVAMIANNYSQIKNTLLRVRVTAGARTFQNSVPLTLAPAEVRRVDLFMNGAMILPDAASTYPLLLEASITDSENANLPPTDCRLRNNGTLEKFIRPVVRTWNPKIQWRRVVGLLDLNTPVSEDVFREGAKISNAYVRATFPLRSNPAAPPSLDAPTWPAYLPATTGVDFVVSVLRALQLPVDKALPFVMLGELNALAASSGVDRMVGVLSSADWFKVRDLDMSGLSGMDTLPNAVLVLPNTRNEAGATDWAMPLAAHELGHTFLLSVDGRLKDRFFCSFFQDVLGNLPCGAVGGYDEYTFDDPALRDGLPASGVWLRQGGEPSQLAGCLGTPQCNSKCFMGAPFGICPWSAGGARWIDDADYNQLLAKLRRDGTPLQAAAPFQGIYVSGFVAPKDSVFLGVTDRTAWAPNEAPGPPGPYSIRFRDGSGRLLGEERIPMRFDRPLVAGVPIIPFGVTLRFRPGTRVLEMWNVISNRVVARREVSSASPKVQAISSGPTPDALTLRWRGSDADGDNLSYTLMLAQPNGEWVGVAYRLREPQFDARRLGLKAGTVRFKVRASDGVNVGESLAGTLTVSVAQITR
jgi:hypothetical protein